MKSCLQDGIHLPSAESRVSSGQRRVFQAMRPATEILTADMTIQDALEKARDSRLGSVTDESMNGVSPAS